MCDKPYLETKTSLTPGEKLKVAYAVLINGWDQMEVASLMGVNIGRVNEAVQAIRKAIDPEGVKAEAAAKTENAKKPRQRRALGHGLPEKDRVATLPLGLGEAGASEGDAENLAGAGQRQAPSRVGAAGG